MSEQRQRGVSLISLMIGLLISMIAFLGMFAVYRVVVSSTLESTRDARVMGERSSATLAAGIYLQRAGFGIEAPDRSVDLLLVDGARMVERVATGGSSVGGNGSGNLLVWRHADVNGGNIACEGLYVPLIAEERGLYHLLPKSCVSPTTSLSSAWEMQPLLSDGRDVLEEHPHSIRLQLNQLGTGECQALGLAGAGNVVATVALEDRNGTVVNSSTCLINFAVEASGP